MNSSIRHFCVACDNPIKHWEDGVWVGDQGPYCPECHTKRVDDDNKTHELWKQVVEAKKARLVL